MVAEHPFNCRRHYRFGLNCHEFAVLLAECGEYCGICKIASLDARPPYLVIDHDNHVGYWAVRGMLCQGCNYRIRDGVPTPLNAAEYLADPWYLRLHAPQLRLRSAK